MAEINSCKFTDMAENSPFAFWQEKERIAKGEESDRKSSTKRSPVTKRVNNEIPSKPQKPPTPVSKSLPRQLHTTNSSTVTTPVPSLVPSKSSTSINDKCNETHRPISRNRPHSVMALSQIFESAKPDQQHWSTNQHISPSYSPEYSRRGIKLPVNSTTSDKTEPCKTATNSNTVTKSAPSTMKNQKKLSFSPPDNTEEVDPDCIQSAPPTMDGHYNHRSNSSPWKTSNTNQLQSSGSFVSYLDELGDSISNVSRLNVYKTGILTSYYIDITVS